MQSIVSLGAHSVQRASGAVQVLPRINEAKPDIPLELFTSIPGNCIVHAATDDSNAPLIRKGEIVVIEGDGKAGWYPDPNHLFLIEWVSAPLPGYSHERRERGIVQPFIGPAGKWHVGGLRRASRGGPIFCCDGPYRDMQHLADKLIGRVVGLYAPSLGRA